MRRSPASSFVPRPVAEVRAAVAALTERVIATLLRDPFAPDEASAVGAALAQLHYVHPDALARSLDVLSRELTADFERGTNADAAAAPQPPGPSPPYSMPRAGP